MQLIQNPIATVEYATQTAGFGRFSMIRQSHIVSISRPKRCRADVDGSIECRFTIRTLDNKQFHVSLNAVSLDKIQQAEAILEMVHLQFCAIVGNSEQEFICIGKGKVA